MGFDLQDSQGRGNIHLCLINLKEYKMQLDHQYSNKVFKHHIDVVIMMKMLSKHDNITTIKLIKMHLIPILLMLDQTKIIIRRTFSFQRTHDSNNQESNIQRKYAVDNQNCSDHGTSDCDNYDRSEHNQDRQNRGSPRTDVQVKSSQSYQNIMIIITFYFIHIRYTMYNNNTNVI